MWAVFTHVVEEVMNRMKVFFFSLVSVVVFGWLQHGSVEGQVSPVDVKARAAPSNRSPAASAGLLDFGNEHWTIYGGDIFNTNPGNVGVGTAFPDGVFEVGHGALVVSHSPSEWSDIVFRVAEVPGAVRATGLLEAGEECDESRGRLLRTE